MTIPNDICRCMGSLCLKKHDCLRFLAPCGDWTPIQAQVCGKDFDGFIAVEIKEDKS